MSLRGGFGFISLFFINPLIILLFQNFTIAKDNIPVNSTQTSLQISSRSPASVSVQKSAFHLELRAEVQSEAPKRYQSSRE